MRRVALVAVSAALLLGACPSRELAWEVELGTSGEAAAFIVVERRETDCAGRVLEQRVLSRAEAMSGAASTRSDLAPGPHAFAVLVVDGACRRIGAGCQAVTLGAGSAPIRVVVTPIEPAVSCGADCPVAACALDGGVGDASRDVLASSDGAMDDVFGPDAPRTPFECRLMATDEMQCSACPGTWCQPRGACCGDEFVCCSDGCRRRDCSGPMMVEP
jgi:hypothetical protein